jgi:hypothetical protein
MLVIGGQQVVDFSVASQSGFNYNVAATDAIFTPSPCDVNHSGSANVSAVQTMINEAMGKAAAADDLNGDGAVNLVDVQIVLGAALGSACLGS